ncbi:hypothetical protein JCM8097_001741 [Rhodosporidiobolus ruineniae]
MQATLITRTGEDTTDDLTLGLQLPGSNRPTDIHTVPASEWSSSTFNASSSSEHPPPGDQLLPDPSTRIHSLPSLSAFGSGDSNEFATFVQGREAWFANPELRDAVEDDLRLFAERSDTTEGYLLTTPLSDGFSGLTPSFLELLRDEFAGPKQSVWVTGLVGDSRGWKREANDRSLAQLTLNTALSLVQLEDLSSLLLPVQPAYAFDPSDPLDAGWTRFFNRTLDEEGRYEAVRRAREVALQGVGTELREPGTLPQIISLLNHRGNTKLAHLSGLAPVPPLDSFPGGSDEAVRYFRGAWKDFSEYRPRGMDELGAGKAGGGRKRDDTVPFAQYSIVRGLSFEESQALGPVLEEAVKPLQEPFSQWVSLEPPYPLFPSTSSPPIFAGLLPTGRPLILPRPSLSLPLPSAASQALDLKAPKTSGALFGLPDPIFPGVDSYTVQPLSLPVLSTVSTTPAARPFLRHLASTLRDLRRVRASVLREYEDAPEWGIGREGIEECRERLETLVDNYGGEEDEEGEEGKDEDEDWTATEPKEDLSEFDLD